MVSLNRSTSIQRGWIIVGMILCAVITSALSACPKDVSTKTHACFTSYSFHFQNMQASPQKLCCGIDVEILRAFCQSYNSAIKCVKQLRLSCSDEAHHAIDKALTNLDGARAGLHELCSDDSIIESYAMYQSCFTFAAGGSENCLQTHLNNSSSTGANIRFLSKISISRMDQFCNEMRSTVDCVHKNIKTMCGEEAARLATILVKPMVRQSTDCDYSVINNKHKAIKQSYPGHHAYISDEHSSGSSSSKGRSKSRNNGSNNYAEIRTITCFRVFMVSVVAILSWSI